MGDSCCNPKSIGYLVEVLEKNLPGVTVKSIRIGSTTDKDVRSGFIGNIHDQVALVCRELTNDSKLKGGFNAIGVSQVCIEIS